MRTLGLLLAIFVLFPATALTADEDKSEMRQTDNPRDAHPRAFMFNGVRVLRLNEAGYAEMLNYYHSVPVYQSRQRDFNNPLYFTTRRNEAGEQRIYRASELHIPLFRGDDDWNHLEMIDGIAINREGESQARGYETFGLPAGDGGGVAPLIFHESVPEEAETRSQSEGDAEAAEPSGGATASGPAAPENTASASGGDKAVRPDLTDRLRKAVQAQLVVQEFDGGEWGFFEPVYVYDDLVYVAHNQERYRVLYRLEPMYAFADERGRSYMVAFPVSGGTLSVMPADKVRIENGYLNFRSGGGGDGQPTGAVTAFNATDCPEGWAEYEPAQGRFVRGIDKSGENIDPAGQREAGATQGDRVGWHEHDLRSKYDGFYTKGALRSHATHGGADAEKNQQTSGAGGEETRPRNVALLYCEKQ